MNKLVLILLLVSSVCLSAESKMDYWKVQRKGANGSLSKFSDEWFYEAKRANLEYIRFNPMELPPNEDHFIVGKSESFEKLNSTDIKLLRRIFDNAHKNDIKIILTMFELPGRVYFDIDERIKDNRIWKDKKYWEYSFELWKQLATEFKDHKAIVGFNPLNEPSPEKIYGHESDNRSFKRWLKKNRGSACDLNLFNRLMVEAIRSVDSETPIILDGYFYSSPIGLPYMDIIDDPNILYAFHNPAPWQFSTYRANKGRYRYPDKMADKWNAPGVKWSLKELEKRLKPVEKFIKMNSIPKYQVIASEVWCDRRVEGCAEFFKDILSLYNKKQWHWAFYTFRNDTSWTGLDYELGSKPNIKNYWYKVENGIDPETLKVREDNPIWSEIQRALE